MRMLLLMMAPGKLDADETEMSSLLNSYTPTLALRILRLKSNRMKAMFTHTPITAIQVPMMAPSLMAKTSWFRVTSTVSSLS